MHSSELLLIIVFSLTIVTEANEKKSSENNSSRCKLEKSNGKECSKAKPSIQWYFDTSASICLAFKYAGCGGNENRFTTAGECEEVCIPEDYGWCALNTSEEKDEHGESRTCSVGPEHLPNDTLCSAGYTCKSLAFFAVCCPKEKEELWEKNMNPICPNGTDLVKVDRGDWQMVLLGKSCDDKFCPVDAECRKQEILAHCCMG
ncbi:hypothetical protein AB6A40_006813 [Gnathostoma spinigerum]|uniref:BPTI/Kunitz inhibitor domain-containing protein n=1 Tax=Gnathostoma spinigerum TaxID=75299 RepID=A0ABD6ES31_9BILA